MVTVDDGLGQWLQRNHDTLTSGDAVKSKQ